MSYKSKELQAILREYVDRKFNAEVYTKEKKLNYDNFVQEFPVFKSIPLDTEYGSLFRSNCNIAYAFAMKEKIRSMRQEIIDIVSRNKY